jgi:hypothetical protein
VQLLHCRTGLPAVARQLLLLLLLLLLWVVLLAVLQLRVVPAAGVAVQLVGEPGVQGRLGVRLPPPHLQQQQQEQRQAQGRGQASRLHQAAGSSQVAARTGPLRA